MAARRFFQAKHRCGLGALESLVKKKPSAYIGFKSNNYLSCFNVFPNEKETLAVSALYEIPDERGVRRAVSRTVTIFLWCQRYEAGRVNIKDLPRPGQAHVVTNSATISAVDELIRQNRRITTREITAGLSISKGT
ncbi:hypothetical protein AVEN_101674-1 [Araneus ventricosus]|uniref:Uncharacterized protein n=1 Tax=Araneus ventricosus TaxID=182803 RepID=A0A4Y2L8L3_ARAVE|nr:hypothetical protein AVEN_101674-1 [Araneus ventricosus]